MNLRPSGYEPLLPEDRQFFDFNRLRDNPLNCRRFLAALRRNQPLPDSKLEALRLTTRAMVEQRGWLSDADVARFEQAGYSRDQLLDLVLAVAFKTLSNYTNHLTETPVDRQFSRFEWHPAG